MEKIYDLLEQKTFAALTDNERAMVLAEMTEQEFTLQRQFIQQTTHALQQEQLQPKPIVHQNLKASFRKQYPSANGVSSLLSLQIPLWMALLGMLSVAIVFSYINQKKTHEPVKPAIEKEEEKIFVYQMDTIYIEKDTESKKPPRDSAAIEYQKGDTVQSVPNHIVQSTRNINYLIEQPLTYYDSNAINNINQQVRGQQLEEDMPTIDVKVWK